MSAIRAKPITAGNDLLDLFMTRIQNDELDVFHNRTYFMHDVMNPSQFHSVFQSLSISFFPSRCRLNTIAFVVAR